MRGLTKTADRFIKNAEIKNVSIQTNFLMLAINGMLAGFFIGLTGFTFQKVMIFTHSLMLAAAVLPLGFILCDTFKSDLFSTHFLYSLASYTKQQSWQKFALSALCVTLFNIFGIIIFILMMWGGGEIDDISSIALSEITMKTNAGYFATFLKGIIGCAASCMGVFTAKRTDSAFEKVMAIWISMFTLGVCGFEHATLDLYHFLVCTDTALMKAYFPNLVLTYLGNLIGGLIFSGIVAGMYNLKNDAKL